MPPKAKAKAAKASFEDVQYYGRTAAALDINEAHHVARLCESGKQLLKQKVFDFVEQAGGSPILMHYSADGTRLKARDRRSVQLGGKKVLCQGERSDEYLVQHMFWRRTDMLGKAQTVALLQDPQPLTEGTTTNCIFSAAKEFIVYPRDIGHTGISVIHYAFDRGLYSSMVKMLRKYEQHLQASAAPPVAKRVSAMHMANRELLVWQVECGCAMHDTHNAVKWALPELFFQDKELLKDLYIIVSSMRNTFGYFHDCIHQWVAVHLQYVEDEQLPPTEALQELWVAMRVDEELADELVGLRLSWSGGRLRIAASQVDRADIGTIASALLSLWRFSFFVDSRWLSVGKSSRSVVCALLTGFDDMMKTVRALPECNDSGISGYDRMTLKAKQSFVKVSMATHVPEAFLSSLLEDSRVPLRVAELEATLDEEMQYLGGVDPVVWEWLGAVCDMSGEELQSQVLAAAHRSIAFVYDRALSAAKSYPWSLAAGNVHANLNTLAAEPSCPEDPTTGKIWQLLHRGFPRAQLVRAVELIGDCPWGTATVEQQHASGTLMRKYHPELGQETMTARAFLHTVRCLLPFVSPIERKMAMIERAMTRLSRCRPRKIHGRQLFVKDLMDLAMQQRKEGRELPDDVHKKIMQRHMRQWMEVPDVKRARYEGWALAEQSRAEQELAEKHEAMMAKLMELKDKRDTPPKFDREPLMLRACALGPDDEAAWKALYQSAAFQPDKLMELRRNAMRAPKVDTNTISDMAHYPVYAAERRTDYPPWLGGLVWGREFFDRAGLFIETDEGLRVFLVMYAKQSPYHVAFSELTVLLDSMPEASASSNWEGASVRASQQFFLCEDFKEVLHWHELPAFRVEEVGVLRPIDYVGGSILASSATLIPLDTYLGWMPPRAQRKAKQETETGGPKEAPVPKAIGSTARATTALQRSLARSQTPRAHKPGSSVDDTPAAVESDSDEDVRMIAELAEALEEVRAAVPAARVEVFPNFKVRLLGDCDAWRGEPRGKAIEAWCEVYFRFKTFRAELTHGKDEAHEICCMWCHRMQYFYDVWQAAGEAFFKFKPADIAAYPEPPEFQALIDRLAGKAKKRAEAIRQVRPK